MNASIYLPLILALAACAPDIATNTYFCGPNGLCPPDLECQHGGGNTFAFSCQLPLVSKPFVCPTRTIDIEPDDDPANADELGTLGCGSQIAFPTTWGCVGDSQDVDNFRFSLADECSGNDPRLEFKIRYPVGAARLAITVLDDSGSVMGMGFDCTPEADPTGTISVCIEGRSWPLGDYTMQVRMADEPDDCDGRCSFNRYQLTLSAPLS